MKPRLFTWGLAQDDFAALSKRIGTIQVQNLSDPPSEAPDGILLIDAGSLPRFVAWARDIERTSGGRPHPVLLFLSANTSEPADLWDFYDGIVDLIHLDILEQMVDCPGIAAAELAAADVPIPFLESLTRPFSTVPIAQYPFGSDEWDRPDSEMRRLLAEDATCRMAFNAALEWRMSMTSTILDAARRTYLEVAVARVAFEERERQNQRTSTIMGVLAAFLQVGEMSVRRRAAQFTRSTRGGTDITEMVRRLLQGTTVPDLSALMEQMAKGLVLESDEIEFQLQLTDDELIFDKLVDRFADPIMNYQVALRRGNEVLWSALSKNGAVALPLLELEQRLNDGAIRFEMLQLPKEA